MSEAIGIFFIAIAVIAVTAILFGGWALVTLVKMILRAVGVLFDSPKSMTVRTCPNRMCGEQNPADARYCRRCGATLPGMPGRRMQNAALW